jgi:hypothetical protein
MTLRLKNRAVIVCFGPTGRGAELRLKRIAEQAAARPRLFFFGSPFSSTLFQAIFFISVNRAPSAVSRAPFISFVSLR